MPPPVKNERRRVSQMPMSERRRASILVGQRSLDIIAMNHPEDKGPRFVRFVIRCYKRYGYFIAEHAWKAIFICLFISGLALFKILHTKQENDITGYSPYGARAKSEYAQYQEFFAHDGYGIALYIFALAKDGGTMLRDEYMKETVEVLDLALYNFTLLNRDTEKAETFDEFCVSFCSINEPVRQFYNGFQVQSESLKKSEALNDRFKLNYPISEMFGRNVSLQPHFFGVEVYNDSATMTDAEKILAGSNFSFNGSEERITNMKNVKIIQLQFRAEHQLHWDDHDAKQWELTLVDYFQNKYKSNRLKLYVLATSYVEEEMVRAGTTLLPYLTVGFLIMCTCSIVSVMTRAAYMHQHNCYKIALAITACVTPFMATATALAIMFICGLRFSSILCVIPFLVLSIGVDSSYLMIHEWQRVTKHCRETPTRKNQQVGYRMSEVLCEVGPAILISTLTNIFADGVGSFTGSPEITLLCVGNLSAMFIAFIYQMTFYSGLLTIVGRYEIENEKAERNKNYGTEISIRDKKVNITSTRHPGLTRQSSKFHDTSKHYISTYMQNYVDFVANKLVASFTVFLYFCYLAFSIWGITKININLTSQKLFALDSPLLELDKLRVEYVVPHFTMATVFVNTPGNLSDPKRLAKMNQFVDDMESINGSWGPVATKYFVRDFMTFQASYEDPEEEEEDPDTTRAPKNQFNEADLATFIGWPEYDYWSGFIRLTNATEDSEKRLEKFFFTTAYHGNQLSVWTERGNMLKTWRRVADRYNDDFTVSVFHEDGVYLDLIDNMPTDTWQSVLGTLVCMAGVCFLFLNNFFTVVIASGCVLSICAGILGILSWMSVDLDPITMAAMIISIGFSVDIPAHVSYHYYQACVREGEDSTPQVKLATCLSSVAFPALQAAISTSLCVSSLLFVKLYMAEVFVKTMVLCVFLCNLHGLVFLPAILISMDNVLACCKFVRNKVHNVDTDAVKNGAPHKPVITVTNSDQPTLVSIPPGIAVAKSTRTPSPNPKSAPKSTEET
ncbi:hypothetical protein QR680_008355 [Steinernema hermaphroditum]|uniref:SSD domain-containing protein n=1 Tax=Steinernema hermaphroditum TaxID=289476 RepID=A0AA39IGB0_9BILA|nr:hypothetical protein QR680_008355 [Steinernema hermaphroditum]